MPGAAELWLAYKLRWRRRRYLARAWRRRHELTAVNFRLQADTRNKVLCFSTILLAPQAGAVLPVSAYSACGESTSSSTPS